MRWSEKVLARDKDCVCGSPATEAHHIYPRKSWPELRNNLNNGIGLCGACHKAVYGKEEDAIEAFLYAREDQAKALGRLLPGILRNRGVKLGVSLRR